jgi:hypothetical protein
VIGFPVKERTLGAFDFLIVVFLNIGNFFERVGLSSMISVILSSTPSRWISSDSTTTNLVHGKGLNEETRYRTVKNEKGFELIAQALGVDYPARAALGVGGELDSEPGSKGQKQPQQNT